MTFSICAIFPPHSDSYEAEINTSFESVCVRRPRHSGKCIYKTENGKFAFTEDVIVDRPTPAGVEPALCVRIRYLSDATAEEILKEERPVH